MVNNSGWRDHNDCVLFLMQLMNLYISVFLLQKENNLAYSEEDVLFFERQLDLFGKLAYVSLWSHIIYVLY